MKLMLETFASAAARDDRANSSPGWTVVTKGDLDDPLSILYQDYEAFPGQPTFQTMVALKHKFFIVWKR